MKRNSRCTQFLLVAFVASTSNETLTPSPVHDDQIHESSASNHNLNTVRHSRPRRAPGSGGFAKTILRSVPNFAIPNKRRTNLRNSLSSLYLSLSFSQSTLRLRNRSSLSLVERQTELSAFVFSNKTERNRSAKEKRGEGFGETETERKRKIDLEWSVGIAHHRCSIFLVRREYLAGRIESSPPSPPPPRPRLRLRGRSTSAP